MDIKKLKKFFNPKTIAVIGATNKPGHVGFSLLENIISGGYRGKIYPVNPYREIIQGLETVHSVQDIKEDVDLAIIATPAPTVPSLVEECGKKEVGGVIIVSSGFKEAGQKGEELYREISEIIKKYHLNVLGPNCLGFIRPSVYLNASFTTRSAQQGKIAFISQSGALCSAILDWSIKDNVGFSYFISIGEMIDLDFASLIDYLGNDPEVNSILIYMESLTNARNFLSAARAYARNKPIVVLKSGKSLAGAIAARSHTGSLAGNDAVYDAAFKRVGILRVNTINNLFDCALSLDTQPIPKGNRLAIVTNAGGPGVIATDCLVSLDGVLADLKPETVEKLNNFLPPAWSKNNPVDILGDADPERYRKAIEICLNDENVDGMLVLLTPQQMTDPEKVAEDILQISTENSKTILTSWMGEETIKAGRTILEKGNIPVFKTPEEAVKSFMYMYNYGRNLDLISQTPATIPHAFTPETSGNRLMIDKILSEGRYSLTEYEAKKMLENYEIPIPQNSIAHSPEDAVRLSKEIGFPVVMKILSPDILHKTDLGAYILNIKSEEEAKNAFTYLMDLVNTKKPNAKILGVLVEKMIHKKYELFFGCKKDPIFGPAIIFGMGGVAVEVFNDVNIGLPPLNMALAQRLIEDTKIYKLLRGYRGMLGADISSIQFILYKFAYLISDFPEISEVDVNPFAVDENGGMVLDARIILDSTVKGKKIKPYSHLCITPYPKEYIRETEMKNGKKAILRPIRPEDEPLEREMFANFSPQTQRYRFFAPLKEVTHEMLVRYTQIDYEREMAIIAEVDENGSKKMAGVVRIIADASKETAEFAIVIADPWQGQGLGSRMTNYILDIAKDKEIKKIYAYFLDDNDVMHHIFVKKGFNISAKNGNLYAELPLQ